MIKLTPPKRYIMACANCDYKVTAHSMSERRGDRYLLKCLKCQKVNPKWHSKTFVKNREIKSPYE